MKLLDNPPVDEHGHIRFAEDEEFYYECWPMGYNDRLVILEKASPYTYDYGWCFPKQGGFAVAAALAVWDPATQDEPVGWHKRVGIPSRRAPRRDEDPEYNRDRCVHGSYMDEPCARNQFCKRKGEG
ncbi:hypothetical protein ACFYP4_02245 [Streptomyces sp. NPDC005551]|uniref:hypothetical protein n=1 Tax=Streptomyces sp. NPDC005551 TaxID=3364725 RepID=UPI0036AA83D1